jgi:hypothetical protein
MSLTIIKNSMKIALLDYNKYNRYYLRHSSQAQTEDGFAEKEWIRLRNLLICALKDYGIVGPSGADEIDLSVGGDWFGDKCFHIVFRGWNVMTPNFILSLGKFLCDHDKYSITLGKISPSNVADEFLCFIAGDNIFISFFESNLTKCSELFWENRSLVNLGKHGSFKLNSTSRP